MPMRKAEATADQTPSEQPCDLLIVGGGINGCGIARDAAGRGLSVTLAEMGDLASATSSASTKLFHGGLRYLEYFEFRLVREALIERETLLSAMPHISWPMRFVLPLDRDMRFDASTPASRLLSTAMPWMTGRRPAWLIRLGLFLYDHLGGRKILPPTRSLDLTTDPAGRPLKPRFRRAFEYSDCWVEDARLVALNARDAAERGAEILTRTRIVRARREDGLWTVTLRDGDTGAEQTRRARILVNAAGPWTADLISGALQQPSTDKVRLVRGSHIVTRRLFEHDRCYFFQGQDGRIVFAIPYETDFTLIGTTDAEHADPDGPPRCTEEERDYLIGFVNRYLAQPISAADIVWTYSGVRPLHDEGEGSASAASRDYVVRLDRAGAPLVNIFGGKITTYRRLAEAVLDKIAGIRPDLPGPWTAGVPLPGGDVAVDGIDGLIAALRQDYPFLTGPWARRLVRAYGTEARRILGGAQAVADLGRDFGATLTGAEVIWLMEREFACRAEDVVWRRSKLGLRMSPGQIELLDDWMTERRRHAVGE
ncbi:glycerol-3-phosphate dehydrogenase [Rhodovulum sp. MB263]|uniref:glycerol-3-phosphate dehydrogenase n=1 Tax=Rhodovulum sp. (strain MB263) TaxID=308754 RepID=UPI001E4BA91F|nr:glycerol-3-phosphate dehydrogenase [Rhodovulum sp. MB263]